MAKRKRPRDAVSVTSLTAKEISQRFNIALPNAYVIKKRGWMTSRIYGDTTPADFQDRDTFLRIFNLKWLNRNQFKLRNAYVNINRERGQMFSYHWLKFVDEISGMRAVLARFINDPTEERFKKVLSHKLILSSLAFGRKVTKRGKYLQHEEAEVFNQVFNMLLDTHLDRL